MPRYAFTSDAREDLLQLGLSQSQADHLARIGAGLTWPPAETPGTEGTIGDSGLGWRRLLTGDPQSDAQVAAEAAAGSLPQLHDHVLVYRAAARKDRHALDEEVDLVILRVLSNHQLAALATDADISEITRRTEGRFRGLTHRLLSFLRPKNNG